MELSIESDDRPWGGYVVLSDAEDHKVKRITVLPGQRVSYQRHERRAEHWFVVSGRGRVTLDGSMVAVAAGAAVDVPQGVAHRIENDGIEPLVFIEVQTGDYFGEDDIERLEDDYGRAPSSSQAQAGKVDLGSPPSAVGGDSDVNRR